MIIDSLKPMLGGFQNTPVSQNMEKIGFLMDGRTIYQGLKFLPKLRELACVADNMEKPFTIICDIKTLESFKKIIMVKTRRLDLHCTDDTKRLLMNL